MTTTKEKLSEAVYFSITDTLSEAANDAVNGTEEDIIFMNRAIRNMESNLIDRNIELPDGINFNQFRDDCGYDWNVESED